MDPKEVEVLVAVQDDAVRSQVNDILAATGYSHAEIAVEELLERKLRANNFVILQTGEDVVALKKTVNQIYLAAKHMRGRIIAIVSNETALRNPRLSFWLVEGASALFALLVPERGDLKFIPQVIERRLSKPDQPDTEDDDDDRDWQALVTGKHRA